MLVAEPVRAPIRLAVAADDVRHLEPRTYRARTAAHATPCIGATAQLNFIWLLADTLNALMALPNLTALLLLSPLVFKLTRDYFAAKA